MEPTLMVTTTINYHNKENNSPPLFLISVFHVCYGRSRLWVILHSRDQVSVTVPNLDLSLLGNKQVVLKKSCVFFTYSLRKCVGSAMP